MDAHLCAIVDGLSDATFFRTPCHSRECGNCGCSSSEDAHRPAQVVQPLGNWGNHRLRVQHIVYSSVSSSASYWSRSSLAAMMLPRRRATTRNCPPTELHWAACSCRCLAANADPSPTSEPCSTASVSMTSSQRCRPPHNLPSLPRACLCPYRANCRPPLPSACPTSHRSCSRSCVWAPC